MSVETIFAAAAQKPASDRAAFLEEACATDPELRRKVERLLKAHDAAGEFLESPAHRPVGTIDFTPIAERVGTKIGPYILREQIGEGGFGLVFVAEQQEPVKRKVALKVIKPGMDSQQVIARFEAERQALALMDHPNIARVLDAGATDSGRPYFVMELVRGISITEYCDQNQLSPRERLDLFVTVCQAIQHAHQKGIIHRDIKPSNVLVTSHDGKPVAKVIDFGVAKAIHQHLTERTIYTNFAQMIGTPLYMSPEQAEMSGLDIDTRSDIYSLGVLLYELLTGTTPLEKKRFKEAAYDEIRRLIRDEEPPKPSTRLSTSESIASVAAQRKTEPAKLSKLMRGDLDWITMKALEKDRTRRYETANGLARDIQRYLSDEPVEACPPSSAYRLRKFARKNRAALGTAAAILLLLTIGGAVSAWQAVRATRAERDVRRAAAEAVAAQQAEAEQRILAETNEQKARSAADAERDAKVIAEMREAEAKAVLNFVESKIFVAARPEGQPGGLGREVKLRQAMDAALPFVDTSFAKQPLIEAHLRMTIGLSYSYLGELRTAAEQFQAANKLFISNLGIDHPSTLESTNTLASCYRDLGQYPEALKLHEYTFARRTAKLGAEHPDTIKSMNNLALCYSSVGRHAEACKLSERTLALMKDKFGPDHPDTLAGMNNLALNYADLGRLDEALKLHEETLALRKARLGPDHHDTLQSMNNLALACKSVGRFADALKLCEQTLALRTARLGSDHPDTLTSMHNLAMSYQDLGRHSEALKLYEETLALRRAKLGANQIETLDTMNNLANCYAVVGRLDEALQIQVETLALRKAKLGHDHPETLRSMTNLANCYTLLGRHADSLKLIQQSLALMKAKFGPDHPDTLAVMNNLALSYGAVGRHAEALTLLEETLAARKRVLGPDHSETIASMNNLANGYANVGRLAEALKLHEETLTARKRVLGENHPQTRESMENLAILYAGVRRFSDAIKLLEETFDRARSASPPDKTRMVGASYNLACVFAQMVHNADDKVKQADLAMDWLKRAVDLGFKNVEHMKKDSDLDSLREREDFKKLLAELETRQPATKP
jgi:serine/threonine protein kinase/tetratricopeptide (TPR) repeat protein